MAVGSNWNIRIQKKSETPESWIFAVDVLEKNDIYHYSIELEKEYHQKLAGENTPPLLLVQQSFLFLLERESPASILKEFNIKEIQTYFSRYEEVMRNTFT